MWRQLSKASTPLDYPTNHQSFCNSWEDESACWITSRSCWCLFFYSPSRVAPSFDLSPPSRHPLCAITRSRPRPSSDWHMQLSEAIWGWRGASAGPEHFPYIRLPVCLSAIHQVWGLRINFLLWAIASTSRDSRRRSTTSAQRDVGGTSMHACYANTQMCNHSLYYPMCIYANTSIYVCLTIKTACFDKKKHSHTRSVEVVFTLNVGALSHCLTHTNYSQHICALWGSSPFTQLEVAPRNIHTHTY